MDYIKDKSIDIPKCYTVDNEDSPEFGIALLRSMGLLGLNVPLEYGGMGHGNDRGNIKILKTLHKIGSYDLSLGRIFEGHLNALLLIDAYGSPTQKEDYFHEALSGKLFGIWNSELPSEPLKFSLIENGYILNGAKVFCSGASHVTRPIVTAEGPDGGFMIILHLDELDTTEDFTYWRPMGMKSSVSCRFDFTDISFPRRQILGKPYDYFGQPDFTGGAIRFAAVQLGGAEAAINITIKHLRKLKRTDAPEQLRRLGQLSILRETGRLWLRKAGKTLDRRHQNPVSCIDHADKFRTIVREICEEVLSLCEMCVGLQGMMQPHPLERIHRDLSVYLKQPGPDKALNSVGTAFLRNHTEKL